MPKTVRTRIKVQKRKIQTGLSTMRKTILKDASKPKQSKQSKIFPKNKLAKEERRVLINQTKVCKIEIWHSRDLEKIHTQLNR